MTRLAHNLAGWGEDWILCAACTGHNDDCWFCGGEGGWPAEASRFDDEPEPDVDECQFQEAAE